MKKYLLVTLGIFLIAIDQIIKWWMIKYHPSLIIENTGMIFGYIENVYVNYILLGIGVGILVWLIFRNKEKFFAFHLLLITAGAISNVIDRITKNAIIDYIKIPGLWFTFNFADVYIFIGVIMYIYYIFTSHDEKEYKKHKNQ